MAEHAEHRWVVDGEEEGMVRVEEDGRRMLVVPRHLLPAGATEGQVLRVTRGPSKGGDSVTVTIAVDAEATASALAVSKERTARAAGASRKRDPGGDVAL